MPLMQFCMYVCLFLVSWFGARMIVSRTLTTGELMSLMTYAIQILSCLMMLSMVFVMITMSRASCERIVEVLDEQSDNTSHAAAVPAVLGRGRAGGGRGRGAGRQRGLQPCQLQLQQAGR